MLFPTRDTNRMQIVKYEKPFILLTPFSILRSGGPFSPFLFGSEPLEPAENRKHRSEKITRVQFKYYHRLLCQSPPLK